MQLSFQKRILTYADLAAMPPGTSDELLVDVRQYDPSIVAEYEKHDMEVYTGGQILVRDAVAKKLAEVNRTLYSDGFKLRVVYGYRHPAVQEKYFQLRRATLALQFPDYSRQQLDVLTHNFVAVPDVAGHPTGGAVDLTILTLSGEVCDMGTAIADYVDPERIQTFSAGLTDIQNAHRTTLRLAMIQAGFAPFYGEWWHFSYGDREWAAFYGKSVALYGQAFLRDSK